MLNIGILSCFIIVGFSSGLYLLLNIESYEHLAGFSDNMGAMLYLHDQQEIPIVADQGVMIPTGMHSMIAIRHTQVRQ